MSDPSTLTFRRRLKMMGPMFGPLGFQEMMFILVVALLIFGPRKLPEIGRTIGRSLAEFRKASTELKRSLNAEIADDELRRSDPRKLVRETFDEVKSLGAEVTRQAAEELAPESPAAAPPPETGAVSREAGPRGPGSASDPDPEPSSP